MEDWLQFGQERLKPPTGNSGFIAAPVEGSAFEAWLLETSL
jgi:hypothetical protein